MLRPGEVVCVDVRPYRFRKARGYHGTEYWLLSRRGFVIYRGITFGPLRPEVVEDDLNRLREGGAEA